MREVQMFDHGERVTLPDGRTGRILYPVSTSPVEFFDPIDDPFVKRVVRVLMPDGEVLSFLASELTSLDD